MARKLVVLAIGFALVLAASASQPGQPLDCSDWVFLEPGYNCSQGPELPAPLGNSVDELDFPDFTSTT